MKKNSTLVYPAESSASVDYPEENMHPKTSTIMRIRSFARAAFSAPCLDKVPVIVLN